MDPHQENEIKSNVQTEFVRLIAAIDMSLRFEVTIVRGDDIVKKAFDEASAAYACYNNNFADSDALNVSAIVGPVEHSGKFREGREVIFAKGLGPGERISVDRDFEPAVHLKQRISDELLRDFVEKTYSAGEEQETALTEARNLIARSF